MATRDALLLLACDPVVTLDDLDGAALDPAREAGIVEVDPDERVRFAHPLFGAAVYAGAPARERRAAHRALAGRVADPEARARHQAAAVDGPDAAVADALVDAAHRARTRGAWDASATLLDQAAVLTPPDGDTVARRLAAADAHLHGGDRGRAQTILEALLLELPAGAAKMEALRLLGVLEGDRESFARSDALLSDALTIASAPGDVAAIELDLCYVAASRADFGRGLQHAARAYAAATEAGLDGLAGRALAHHVMFRFLTGNGVDAGDLERAVALEEPDRSVPLSRTPRSLAACLALYTGRLDVARVAFHALAAEAVAAGDENEQAFHDMWLSWLEMLAGRFDAAEAVAAEGLRAARLAGSDALAGWLVAQLALLAAHRGDAVKTRARIVEATDTVARSGNVLGLLWHAAAGALAGLVEGDPATAWAACLPLASAVEASGVAEPVVWFFLPMAVEALVDTGDLDRAAALLAPFQAQARALDRPYAAAAAARSAALLAAARGDPAGARAASDEAFAAHARVDMPFEHARTLLIAGRVLRRQKARREAQGVPQFSDRGVRSHWCAGLGGPGPGGARAHRVATGGSRPLTYGARRRRAGGGRPDEPHHRGPAVPESPHRGGYPAARLPEARRADPGGAGRRDRARGTFGIAAWSVTSW